MLDTSTAGVHGFSGSWLAVTAYVKAKRQSAERMHSAASISCQRAPSILWGYTVLVHLSYVGDILDSTAGPSRAGALCGYVAPAPSRGYGIRLKAIHIV